MRVEFEEWARQAADAVEKAAAKAQAASGKKVMNGLAIANCVRRILGVPLPGEPIPRGQFEMDPSPRRPEQQVDTHLPQRPKTGDDLRGEEIAAEVRRQLGVPLGPARRSAW